MAHRRADIERYGPRVRFMIDVLAITLGIVGMALFVGGTVAITRASGWDQDQVASVIRERPRLLWALGVGLALIVAGIVLRTA